MIERERANQRASKQRTAAIFLMAVIISGVLLAGLYYARRSGPDPTIYGNDFSVYYFAAAEMVEGRDPYQNSIGEWVPYLYTPLLAELLMPLALLPIRVAAYIWFLISSAAVALAMCMLARSFPLENLKNQPPPVGSLEMFAAAGAVLIAARFVLDTFYMGQVNTVVMMLAVAHVYLYSKNRKIAAGFMLALAATMKVTTIVLIFYHRARLRFKYAAACVGLIALVAAMSFAGLGRDARQGAQTFFNRTIANGQGFDLKYSGNQSLRGFELRLYQESEDSNRVPRGPITIIISLVLLAAAWLASRRGATELEAAAPFFCLAVILSPLSWKDHYVIIIPAVTAVIWRFLSARTRSRRVIFGLIIVGSFLLFNITSWRIIGLFGAEWADAHSLIFTGGILIFLAVLMNPRVGCS